MNQIYGSETTSPCPFQLWEAGPGDEASVPFSGVVGVAMRFFSQHLECLVARLVP